MIKVNESILQELLAENAMLREKLDQRRSELSSRFVILQKKPLKIHGVLIAEGVWKGVLYDYNEMKKSKNKFLGLPLKVQHGHSEDFGDKEVGKITKVKEEDLLKSLTFEAEVTDPKAIELVKNGTLDAVSIKGSFELVDTSSTPPKGVNYTPEEVSLTPSPACEFCQVFNYELSKRCKELISQEQHLNKEIPIQEVGDQKMEELNENEVYIAEDDLLIFPELTEEGQEGEFEVIKESDYSEELARKKRAVKVRPGVYPKKVKRVVVKKGKKVPKYPYYGYYPYYYSYGYPYYYYYSYPYYGYPKKLSEEEIIDTLLEGDYKTFMKKCMKSGKDMKTCAKEWKEKTSKYPPPKKEEETSKEEKCPELELAEIKCPVCGKVFKTRKEFLKHWEEKHAAKYGEYGQVRKLIRDLKEKPELKKALKKHFELSKETPKEELKEEVKQEEPKKEEVKKEEEKHEETPKQEKEKTEEKTQETPKTESVPEPPKKNIDEIVKELTSPEKAAELLIASNRKED